MVYPSQERLLRKEQLLGFVRERDYPAEHIGLRLLAPFMDVDSDDVFFEYVQFDTEQMAPGRAEDAEAEMATTEDTFGEGRASLVDWAFKNRYKPSDISKYQDVVFLEGKLGGNLPRSITVNKEAFLKRVARDTARRRKALDNRIEWMIQQAVWESHIAYANSKIKFDVDYDRPDGQNDGGAPSSPSISAASVTAWDNPDADPIQNALAVKAFMRDEYGVRIDRAIVSERTIRALPTTSKFVAKTGFAIPGSSEPSPTPLDPAYLIQGWGDGIAATVAIFQQATGIKLIPYDAARRVRATPTTKTTVMKRYSPDDKILFLPSQDSVDELDDNIGFGKTFTAPHPEGNWTPGYYEWEKVHGPDPWGHDFGNGIKAFPVFPHLDLTYILKVLA